MHEQERLNGQIFRVDIDIQTNIRKAITSDDIEQTVDYSRVVRIVKNLVEGPPYSLLEALAGSLSDQILELANVEAVSVKVMKPDVDLNDGNIDYASVSIHRSNG